MGGGLPVNAGNLLSGSGATIGREFWDTYAMEYAGEQELVNLVSNPDIPSQVEQQPEGYFETAPYPAIWPRGDTISGKPFQSVQHIIYNRSWGRRVEYNEDDLVYEQTRSLLQIARMAGKHWATLDVRVLIQFMTAATDPNLVPGTILSPDGAAMYATTAGGSNRFGVSNGNSISGAYMDASYEVLDGIAAGLNQFASFTDTEGQPLLDPGVLSEVVVVAPIAYATVFRQAFNQPLTSAGSSGPAVTNYILNSGASFKLWLTPRLTAKVFYMFLPRAQKRSFGKAVVTPLRETYADMSNSDEARASKKFYNQWDSRHGYYLWLPFSTMKISDS